MKVLIIIPAYNEEKNLPALLQSLREYCPEYDVLVINDCSRDNTLLTCKENGVNVVDIPINLGIGGAVQTGYKFAQYNAYDIAVQVDGDGQHNPAYIPKLVKEIENGSTMCIGSRFIENKGYQSTIIRRAGIAYFSRLIWLFTGKSVTDPTSGFRACNKKVIRIFAKEYPRDYPEPETIVMLSRNRFKISEIPVVMNERKEGTSSISSIKSVYYMFKVTLAIIIAAISISNWREKI